MNPSDIQQPILDHPFFLGLEKRHLQLLASHARLVQFATGQRIAKEGEPATSFYLLIRGHVGIELHGGKRGMIPVQTLGPGDPVGWSWLVPPHRWHFDCHVLDHAEALVLEAPWLLKECERDHELGYQLLRRLVGTLSSRLAATRLQLLDLHQ